MRGCHDWKSHQRQIGFDNLIRQINPIQALQIIQL